MHQYTLKTSNYYLLPKCRILQALMVCVFTIFEKFLFLGYASSSTPCSLLTLSTLKICRTTLIPKQDQNLDKETNWRPITVAPILIRIFHRILIRRLSTLLLHRWQRGFRSINGTLANTILLQALIKQHRASTLYYQITTIDLRKAFDMTPYWPVTRALRRFSVGHRLIIYLENNLAGSTTKICINKKTTNNINILRGVK